MSLILVDLFWELNINIKITEIEGKIPSITGLAPTIALVDLVKKSRIWCKWWIYEWNTWCKDKRQRVNKSDISRFIDKKIATLATKAELKAE